MILGVDFSLTGTGLCAITNGDIECITVRSKPGETWWSHPERVRGIAAEVADWTGEPPAWVIESPSFGSKGPGHDKVLSGWWVFLDYLMRERGWEPPLRAAPAQVKMFALGKGGGPGTGKAEVTAAVRANYPEAAAKNDDEADAVVLALIAAGIFREPYGRPLTAHQQQVVADVRDGKTKRGKK